MHKLSLVLLMTAAALWGWAQCALADVPLNMEEQQPPMVGGRCFYQQFEGLASIVSITPAARPSSPQRFEVRFSFKPETGPVPHWALPRGRLFLMTRENGRLPGRAYLRRNQITQGQSYQCIMKVIKEGTCTPVIFEWPFSRP